MHITKFIMYLSMYDRIAGQLQPAAKAPSSRAPRPRQAAGIIRGWCTVALTHGCPWSQLLFPGLLLACMPMHMHCAASHEAAGLVQASSWPSWMVPFWSSCFSRWRLQTASWMLVQNLVGSGYPEIQKSTANILAMRKDKSPQKPCSGSQISRPTAAQTLLIMSVAVANHPGWHEKRSHWHISAARTLS